MSLDESYPGIQPTTARKAGDFLTFTFDGTKQPKSLTISEFPYSDKSGKRRQSRGIYKFDGDQLTLAYRQGGPPPEKFESKPGSGITLLVLRRAKPKTWPKPDEPKAGEIYVPPSPATIPTARGSILKE
jgi:hypothetical protein